MILRRRRRAAPGGEPAGEAGEPTVGAKGRAVTGVTVRAPVADVAEPGPRAAGEDQPPGESVPGLADVLDGDPVIGDGDLGDGDPGDGDPGDGDLGDGEPADSGAPERTGPTRAEARAAKRIADQEARRALRQRRLKAAAIVGRVGLVTLLWAGLGGGVWAVATWGAQRQSDDVLLQQLTPQQEVAPSAGVGPVLDPAQVGPVGSTRAGQAGGVQQQSVRQPRTIRNETLVQWANRIATGMDIPARAAYAYGMADLVMRNELPSCRLSWATLAGIGHIESNHGRYGGAYIALNGQQSRPIIGVALDGTAGNKNISDTDGGRLDGDPALDRAVGPMQFIPSTWMKWRSDGNGDGVGDPQNIDDAALTAARYLCAGGGRDLSTGEGWWRAILSYNRSIPYGETVYRYAQFYAEASGR